MYILHLKQRYEGCDYSISCGETLRLLESTDRDEALKETEEIIIGVEEDEYAGDYIDENEIDTAILYKVSDSEEINLDVLYKKVEKYHEKIDDSEEYEEYLRLKEKFE